MVGIGDREAKTLNEEGVLEGNESRRSRERLLDVRANDVEQACAPQTRVQVESEPTWDIHIHTQIRSQCVSSALGGR